MKNLLLLLCLPLLLQAEEKKAIFAGGCFWCMEAPFDAYAGKGVISTVVGYTGGRTENPTYKEVSSGETGHAEAVEITYDPEKISYEKLLNIFWHNIDPTVKDQQFCDVGEQYRSAIFYLDEEQKEKAIASKEKLPFPKIFTEIVPAKTFYPAEEYHQNFYEKNPLRYRLYRILCGRDKRLKELWKN